MRPLPIILFALGGALLAYLVARQVAPQSIDDLEVNVISAFEGMIARFEGYRSEPYLDEAGKWTIGFGHLIVPGDGIWSPSNPGGLRKIEVSKARELYDADTATARAAVANSVRVPITEAQEEVLVSLAYNIGAHAFATSTLVRMLNAGNYAGAADQFLVWNKVRDENNNLVVSAGLSMRRGKERDIFLT